MVVLKLKLQAKMNEVLAKTRTCLRVDEKKNGEVQEYQENMLDVLINVIMNVYKLALVRYCW